MDLTATLMPPGRTLLTITPGFSLLEKPARHYTIVADWDRVAYVTKASFLCRCRQDFFVSASPTLMISQSPMRPRFCNAE
jgi:hypothetical protein